MQDLVYPGAGDGHNWRSIVLSLLVIGLVIAGIVTAIYMLGYVDELLYWSGRRMKLDEFLAGDLSPRRLPPVWVSRAHFVFQDDLGSLVVLDTDNISVTTLVTNHTLVSTGPSPAPSEAASSAEAVAFSLQRQLDVKGYECSGDLRFVLFRHNVKRVSPSRR